MKRIEVPICLLLILLLFAGCGAKISDVSDSNLTAEQASALAEMSIRHISDAFGAAYTYKPGSTEIRSEDGYGRYLIYTEGKIGKDGLRHDMEIRFYVILQQVDFDAGTFSYTDGASFTHDSSKYGELLQANAWGTAPANAG